MSAVLLIPAALGQRSVSLTELASVPDDVLRALAAVADPRRRRGVRHGCTVVLAIAVCAVLAGATSYLAIAEWAHDLTPTVRARLGVGRRPPCEATIRRVLQQVDPDQLDRAVSAFLARRIGCHPPAGRRVLAVDGKSVRGARPRHRDGLDGRAVHLLAAFDSATGAVLGRACQIVCVRA